MPLPEVNSSDSLNENTDRFTQQHTHELACDQDFHRQFQDFCRELHFEPSLTSTPATIAAEYNRLFQSDRTWVLMASGTIWFVKAASGIPSFQRRAEVLRTLEHFVALIGRTKKPFHWSAGTSNSGLSPRVTEALDRYLDEAHICNIRVEPLLRPDIQDVAEVELPAAQINAIVVCEWFQPAHHSQSEVQWTAARQQAAIAFQNAFDWSQIPFAQALRRWRRAYSWRFLSGWGLAISLVSIAAVASALIPISYTIEATGELKPLHQRHVFARSPGIVRTLAVSSGTEVSEGTTLLQLDSPELELEIRRAEGELQTAEKRIASIEASRLDFGLSAPDSANQMNSLAGELKEHQQKRDNLGRDLELLSLRRNELQVISPINGRVVTWDLEQLLLSRPVSRGQRLLTISDTEGPWELELRVLDEDSSDLFAAIHANPSVPIEFVAVTMPDRIYSTTLKNVSETVEIRSTGDSPSLLCRADVPESLEASAVEGMSVRGRIHCGRRAAFVVVFGKLWRAIKENILFPWGW